MSPAGHAPRPSIWRATVADPLDYFPASDVARAREYQRPLRRARLLRAGLSLSVIVAALVLGVAPAIVDGLAEVAWPVQLLVVLVVLEIVLAVIDVPIDVWVDFGHDRRWDLSTQTPRTFVTDQLKSFVLSTVMGLVVLVPLYALVRTTEWWWLVGWLLVTALGVVLGFVFPVVIAPLFNRFEPLPDGELAERLRHVATEAQVPIAGVLVADESRRSRRDNAYVSGLGATRRVVLYDTILEHPPELIEQVVAHELGHWRLHHLRQQIPLLAATTLVAFVVLRLMAGWDALFTWLDVDGLGDPASLPLLLLGAQAASVLVGLVTSWFSRAHEREADLDALGLLRMPDAMAEMLRRLHVKNLADLDPGRLQRWTMSHPPAAERLALVDAWVRSKAAEPRSDPFTSM
jgi:STE24 endopeptidase